MREFEVALSARRNVLRSAFAVGVLAFSAANLVGCGGEDITIEDAANDARARYAQAFGQLAPVDKFIVQYTELTDVRAHARREDLFPSNISYNMRFGDACLKNKIYDVAPDPGKKSGAYAFTLKQDSDKLKVVPRTQGASSLVFSGVTKAKRLKPYNTEAKKVVRDYGCKVGLRRILKAHSYDPYAEWVK